MAVKRALITGVTGQDGAYLARLLLESDYIVYGGYRRNSGPSTWRLRALGVEDKVHLVPLEVLEFGNVARVIRDIRPDELYNFAAQSFVGVSFEQPLYSADVNGVGACRLLEAVRLYSPDTRFYQASTSEMFGEGGTGSQDEKTPLRPVSPYGSAKAFAHWMTVGYRTAHGMHASCGIAFNHESALRGEEFVTRKIVRGLARLRAGVSGHVSLGNVDARRDWGFAGDYVRGMWLMLQRSSGDDFVLATGQMHSVKEFAEQAADHMGFSLRWEGNKEDTLGRDRRTGRVLVRVDPSLYRPRDIGALCGDATRARDVLGWHPVVTFERLVAMMAEAEVGRDARAGDLGL